MSHTNITSPTSVHCVGDEPPPSISHTGRMFPTIVSDVGGIHTIENPRRLRHMPKFLCRICEGYHLTCLFPTTVVVPKEWSFPGVPLGYESYLVSQHSISPMIDTTFMPMQSTPNATPVLEGGVSLGLFVMHPNQKMVGYVVIPMQYLVNKTLILEGDASFNHVISISSTAPSK
jgi:hypothetical protein